MKSCIFHGRLEHRRRRPVRHAFRYPMAMMYLDLDELDGLLARFWLWSAPGTPFAAFRRADHVGDSGEPLSTTLRRLVRQRTGHELTGPIRLLTQASSLGFRFNSVNFYYCFDDAGESVAVVVAEVTNTPWGERHCYVLPVEGGRLPGEVMRFSQSKQLHVSPFMPMDVEYDWALTAPAERLSVNMRLTRQNRPVFDANMRLRRREISARSLAWLQIAYPLMNLRAFVGIYWQALRLWLKRCPPIAHPDARAGRREAAERRSGT
jgi:DUF1365 family protein